MGRVKVTPKGKIKKNIPITRVGKKQYLKRRFAHVRAVDTAGSNNPLTQKYFEGNHTAEQTFNRLGLTLDPSASKAQQELKKKKVRPNSKRHFEEEEEIARQTEQRKLNKIARPVSEEEGTVIHNLLMRYGTNLKQMRMDHKLNPFQLNERQLQRQIVNYLKWERAAFPKAFKEAEEKGWFSVEMYENPKLRSSIAMATTNNNNNNSSSNSNNNNSETNNNNNNSSKKRSRSSSPVKQTKASPKKKK